MKDLRIQMNVLFYVKGFIFKKKDNFKVRLLYLHVLQ